MDFTGPYKLEVKVNLPESVVVDELYEITYEVKNLSHVSFPGGVISFVMKWSALEESLLNRHVLEIKELKSGGNHSIPFKQKDQVSGMTYLIREEGSFHANNGILIFPYHPNGNFINEGQLINSLRVKSMEEVLQGQLITALEKSSKSQDRLAKAEVFLGFVAVFFTLVQIIMALSKL